MDDFGDISIGLTEFDAWLYEVFKLMVYNTLTDVKRVTGLDRDHWWMYYDFGFTPEEAFTEDFMRGID